MISRFYRLFIGLVAFNNIALSGEYPVGKLVLPPCTKVEYKNQIVFPGVNPQQMKLSVFVTGKNIDTPENQDVVRQCIKETSSSIGLNVMASDTAGASALFKQTLEQCLRSKAPHVRVASAFIKTQSSCAWYELKATAQATGRQISIGPEYKFTIFINSPPNVLDTIEKITYDFNHPTFNKPHREATDASTRFEIQYVGWGCLDLVDVKIFLKDGTMQTVEFDMCKSLGSDWKSNP